VPTRERHGCHLLSEVVYSPRVVRRRLPVPRHSGGIHAYEAHRAWEREPQNNRRPFLNKKKGHGEIRVSQAVTGLVAEREDVRHGMHLRAIGCHAHVGHVPRLLDGLEH